MQRRVEAPEPQRAIIIGEHCLKPGEVVEARAWINVPGTATVLSTPDPGERLILQGWWHRDNGFMPPSIPPIPMGPESRFRLALIPDSGDAWNSLFLVKPRTIICEHQKIFGEYDPAVGVVIQGQRYLVSGRPVNFRAMWESIGSR